MKKMRNDPDILKEYDFSRGVRGKYAKRFTEGTKTVIDPTRRYERDRPMPADHSAAPNAPLDDATP